MTRVENSYHALDLKELDSPFIAVLSAICMLLLASFAAEACPWQTPHKEACIVMGVHCIDAIGDDACNGINDIDIHNAWVGCQVSDQFVQCLPGVNVPDTEEDEVTCYMR